MRTMYIYSARHIMEHYSKFFLNAANNEVNIFYSPQNLKSNAILGRIQMIKLQVIN